MSWLSSRHVVAVQSELPESTLSTSRNVVTGRRSVFGPETGLYRSKSRANKRCSLCGQAKTGRGSTCRPCYQRVRRVVVVLKCVLCGAEFQRLRYEVEKAIEKRGLKDQYCSPACSMAHHAVKWTPPRPCPVCGHTRPKARRYCSDVCKAAMRKTRSRRTLPMGTCSECGVAFTPKSSRTTYCTRGCADKAHSKRMVGPGNSHFKTGASYSAWFKKMRPLILRRDSHACVACGATIRLLVHHINEKPRENWPENLVTLCGTHHAVHHKSRVTPYPQLGAYAQAASQSMTSGWKVRATTLRTAYSSTTA